MLLFTCARDSTYAEVKKYGLRQSGMGHRLMRSFDEAVKQCTGRLLVVEFSRAELQDCKVRDDVVVAPRVRLQSFRNLNPYAPAAPVTAAGGVLVRRLADEVEVLMIHRSGKWDLPKGKLDSGETIEECARREVIEELGIRNVEIICPLEVTIHGYRQADKYLIKTTHWFLMCTDAKKFKPQKSENIDRTEWMTWKEARESTPFESLREMLKSVKATAQRKA